MCTEQPADMAPGGKHAMHPEPRTWAGEWSDPGRSPFGSIAVSEGLDDMHSLESAPGHMTPKDRPPVVCDRHGHR